MHYYSVFKDQPFWGERKLYSLNPDRVNGYVRILRRNFHRPRREAPPNNNLRILTVEVKPQTEGKSHGRSRPARVRRPRLTDSAHRGLSNHRRDLRRLCTVPDTGEASPLSAIGPAGASLYDSFSSVTLSDGSFSWPGGKSTATVARPSSPTRKSAAQIGAPCFGIHQMR